MESMLTGKHIERSGHDGKTTARTLVLGFYKSKPEKQGQVWKHWLTVLVTNEGEAKFRLENIYVIHTKTPLYCNNIKSYHKLLFDRN